jgi:phosphoglycolate phosphatase
MAQKTGSAIFFDLDGTLTDPKIGITRSIQYALERLDKPVPTTDELTWCIGPPLLDSFAELTGDATLAPRALAFYRERFSDVGLFENDVYPGIDVLLQSLAANDHRLFVATSKPRVYAERILRHFDLAGHFLQVFGAEMDGARSDKTELLAFALAETGQAGVASTMIGDRKHDAVGAVNNGMTALGVLYGYGDEAELSSAGTMRNFETVADLSAYLLTDPTP